MHNHTVRLKLTTDQEKQITDGKGKLITFLHNGKFSASIPLEKSTESNILPHFISLQNDITTMSKDISYIKKMFNTCHSNFEKLKKNVFELQRDNVIQQASTLKAAQDGMLKLYKGHNYDSMALEHEITKLYYYLNETLPFLFTHYFEKIKYYYTTDYNNNTNLENFFTTNYKTLPDVENLPSYKRNITVNINCDDNRKEYGSTYHAHYPDIYQTGIPACIQTLGFCINSLNTLVLINNNVLDDNYLPFFEDLQDKIALPLQLLISGLLEHSDIYDTIICTDYSTDCDKDEALLKILASDGRNLKFTSIANRKTITVRENRLTEKTKSITYPQQYENNDRVNAALYLIETIAEIDCAIENQKQLKKNQKIDSAQLWERVLSCMRSEKILT